MSHTAVPCASTEFRPRGKGLLELLNEICFPWRLREWLTKLTDHWTDASLAHLSSLSFGPIALTLLRDVSTLEVGLDSKNLVTCLVFFRCFVLLSPKDVSSEKKEELMSVISECLGTLGVGNDVAQSDPDVLIDLVMPLVSREHAMSILNYWLSDHRSHQYSEWKKRAKCECETMTAYSRVLVSYYHHHMSADWPRVDSSSLFDYVHCCVYLLSMNLWDSRLLKVILSSMETSLINVDSVGDSSNFLVFLDFFLDYLPLTTSASSMLWSDLSTFESVMRIICLLTEKCVLSCVHEDTRCDACIEALQRVFSVCQIDDQLGHKLKYLEGILRLLTLMSFSFCTLFSRSCLTYICFCVHPYSKAVSTPKELLVSCLEFMHDTINLGMYANLGLSVCKVLLRLYCLYQWSPAVDDPNLDEYFVKCYRPFKSLMGRDPLKDLRSDKVLIDRLLSLID